MTIADALNRISQEKPHTMTDGQMKKWLSTLDMKVYEELMLKRVPDDHVPPFFDGYSESTDDMTELLIREPDADDVYVAYLSMQIDQVNQEIADWQNSASRFAVAFDHYKKKYAREHGQRKTHYFTYN